MRLVGVHGQYPFARRRRKARLQRATVSAGAWYDDAPALGARRVFIRCVPGGDDDDDFTSDCARVEGLTDRREQRREV